MTESREATILMHCALFRQGVSTIANPGAQEKLQRVSRTDQVYESLRSAVIQGQLEPGSRLNQVDLATELDVSERTVREALMQLISEGLLSREPYTEVRVVRLSTGGIKEVLRMRIPLEGWAIELAAAEISHEELDRMRGLLPQMEARKTIKSASTLRSLYRDFHQIAFNACRRKYLSEMVSRLFDRMLPYVLSGTSSEEDHTRQIETDLRHCQRLLEALELGDGKKAREIRIGYLNEMIEMLGED